uniref:Uncharacterized protein n=1 Tax=Nelumbo nucifera TaxID=4432 RepID=A0A822YVN8_NELNU|nr:TPA_asm: hypothetical protein HUJ06_007258 [Nelumbo nucifera]
MYICIFNTSASFEPLESSSRLLIVRRWDPQPRK